MKNVILKKVFRYTKYAVIIGLFIWTAVFLIMKAKKEPELFETKYAFKNNVIKKTVATGKVVPRKEVKVKPQISGILSEIKVKPGDEVRLGDVIAKVRIIPNMENLNSAESQLSRAKISFDDAKLDFDRQKELFDKQVISKSEFQKANTAFNNAKEGLRYAEDNLQLIKEGVTKSLSNSSNTLIRSTTSGMVLDVPVKEGDNVIQTNTFNDGTTIAIIADMNDMIFEGQIDESEVGKIKSGMNLELNIGAIEKTKFKAKLTFIAPKGREENGSVQFEIKADVKIEKGQYIRSGYSANADIILERLDSVLVIDESLIKYHKDSAYVQIIAHEKPLIYKEKYIKLGLSDGINVHVIEGLTLKDKIKGNKIDNNKKMPDQKK